MPVKKAKKAGATRVSHTVRPANRSGPTSTRVAVRSDSETASRALPATPSAGTAAPTIAEPRDRKATTAPVVGFYTGGVVVGSARVGS